MAKKVTRLYTQFQPEHYDLQLDIDREAMTFSGTVTVRGKKTGRPAERLNRHSIRKPPRPRSFPLHRRARSQGHL
jgi:hypothetical protein